MYFSIFNFLIIGLCNSLANFSFSTISFLTAPSTVFLLYIFKYLRIYKYFRISGQSLIKENCYNSRTSDNIDLKLRPVTRIGKRNTTTSKKLTRTSCQKTVMPLPFVQFMANLEQSRSLIPDA